MTEQRERAEHGGLRPVGQPEPSDDERAWAFEVRQAERHGSPTLEHFRRAYREFGAEWPGDDVVRSRHILADAED